jgi:REP element-mobilizing transposase RayT
MNKLRKLPKRKKTLRLQDYDYSQNNAYFITICTYKRKLYFRDNKNRLIVQRVWDNLPRYYDNIVLDEFKIMPNHVHGIILINNSVGADLRSARSLSEIIRAFKSFPTREANKLSGNIGQPFRQRNFYDHIIRNDKDLYSRRKYIIENPQSWAIDEENPLNV